MVVIAIVFSSFCLTRVVCVFVCLCVVCVCVCACVVCVCMCCVSVGVSCRPSVFVSVCTHLKDDE